MNKDNNNSNDIEVEKILNEIRKQQNYTPKKAEEAVTAEEPKTEKVKESAAPAKAESVKPVPKQAAQKPEESEDFVDIYAHLNDLSSTVQIPKITPEVKKAVAKAEKPAAKPASKPAAAPVAESAAPAEAPSAKAEKPAEAPVIQAEEKKAYIPVNDDEPKKDKKNHHIAVAVFAAILLAASAFAAVMFLNPSMEPAAAPVIAQSELVASKDAKDVFVKGIQVAGIDVGGKTVSEATMLLSVKADDVVSKFDVTVNYGDKTLDYTQDDFVYSYDAEATVKQAFEYSKQVEAAMNAGKDSNITPPSDATTSVDAETGTVNFSIPCDVTEASVAKVVKKISQEWDVPMVEPHIAEVDTSKDADEMCTYEDGSTGTLIDTDKLHEDFMTLFAKGGTSGNLTVESYKKEPTQKIDDVKASFVKLAQFSTTSSNTWNATQNMKTALNYINGSIIRPGETWSYNETTGNSNLESNGFLPAGVISGGKMTTGVGGGICQAASTLYNAAIRANMEIVERQPHLWCSYYVYGGLDATIDYGSIDLKLKNTTKYDMVFKTWMDGYTLHTEIYGWQDPSFDEVRTRSWITWQSGQQYGTDAERVYFLDGEEIGTEELPSSIYSTSEGHAMIYGDPGTESTKIEHPKKQTTTEAATETETTAAAETTKAPETTAD